MLRTIKDIAVLALIAAAAWYAYKHFEGRIHEALGIALPPATVRILPDQFKCDGRIYCSQMTSCEEARFFLTYCPNTRLDRNGEGLPCEAQWCK